MLSPFHFQAMNGCMVYGSSICHCVRNVSQYFFANVFKFGGVEFANIRLLQNLSSH